MVRSNRMNCETYIRMKDLNLFLVDSDYSVHVWHFNNVYSLIALPHEPKMIREFVKKYEFTFSNN